MIKNIQNIEICINNFMNIKDNDDVVVIDMNDNQQLDEPDVVVDREGNMATMGELMAAAGEDSSQDYTSMDSSEDMIGADDDVAPSTPDYVDDADLVYV